MTTVLEDVSADLVSVKAWIELCAAVAPTLVVRAANGAGENDVLFASTAVEQVTAVCAENERADGRHIEVLWALSCV